ncbi:ATP-binding protein [Sphingomonas echinoides]|uniref:histidine kinase n=1 Tax=Sphingomonas echinoides TaxID=59803 RepID=A0ABU4PMD8_9SPHN|nr:ATP-binding protein [Sphingomonas echinoides]MDX5985276.1 ATP-binding protein [Sphingomonas echinoides]
MRLFSGLFLLLAGQALLVAVLPGSALIVNLQRGQHAYLEAQDRQSLIALSALIATQIRAGTPLAGALPAAQEIENQNTAAGAALPPLKNRVALYTVDGAHLAGAAPDAEGVRAAQPVMLAGQRRAILKIVAGSGQTLASYTFMRDQLLGIAAAAVATLLLLLGCGYGIAARWVRPQRALFRASRAIAHGDFATDFNETGPVETRATMRNLAHIARRFDRLESARRTWLVAVSEELRVPVLRLGENVAALYHKMPDKQREFAEVAEGVQRLQEMAEDLHAVALADLGRLPVTFATVDPVALIHNAVWANSRRAKAQSVSVEPGQLPATTVLVKWDGARIEQLFTALIESSLRYTPAGGRIALGLEGHRNAWRLIIDDSAPGVDVGLAQQLFEPFYRTTKRPGESVTTSGLGLATAQAIVEAHHGRIEAGPSPLGGLRVTVILPATPPTA